MVKSLKALLLFASVALLAATVWANTTVFVEISWNSPDASSLGPADLTNLQAGSIVQIIGCPSDGFTPESVENGGMAQYGTKVVDVLDEHGDPTGETVEVPVLLPNTVPEGSGWQILETAHVQQIGNTDYYTVSVAIELPAGIDKIFVRVFSNTEFHEAPNADEGWWNISSANDVSDPTIGMSYTWFDNIALTNHAYFEVIPEPTTIALIGSGFLVFVFRRKRTPHIDVSARSSHDEGGLP